MINKQQDSDEWFLRAVVGFIVILAFVVGYGLGRKREHQAWRRALCEQGLAIHLTCN